MCQHCVGCNPECPECHPAWLEQFAARRCQSCQRLNPSSAVTCVRCGKNLVSCGVSTLSSASGFCLYVGETCEHLCAMAQVKGAPPGANSCVRTS